MGFITLIRPPFVYSRRAYSKPVVPPLNVAYLASYLREYGHRVKVIDALAEGLSHSAETSRHPQKNVFLNKSETVFEQRILEALKRRVERYGKSLRGAANPNVPAIHDTGSL